jgi:endonuclease/exonuclease/phosphatase family metal-dependent hydrolase
MGQIKLGVWNMEWLNDLFVAGTGPVAFKPDHTEVRGPPGSTVASRKARIADGLADLDLDALVVVEGPSRGEELQLLFDDLAPGEWRTFVQISRTRSHPVGTHVFASQQNVGVALRTDRGAFADPPLAVFDAMDPGSGLIHDISEPFHYDIGADKVPEWFRFERRPLYVEITMADGASFRVLGLHLKSKALYSAYEWSRWWSLADANRERLLAQCRRIRTGFLDVYLSDAATRDIPLIVCGDINDGPGFDTSEVQLQASGVETLTGSVWRPDLTLGNALFDSLAEDERQDLDFRSLSTTRFSDPIFNNQYHYVWIDHVLYSQTSSTYGWVQGAEIRRYLVDGTPYYRISDHYPVIANVILNP